MSDPYVLLPYQQRFWVDESPVIVWEKSRRIGASWAVAGKAVELAISNQMDTYYASYSEESGKDFIRDATYWAGIYGQIVESSQLLDDEGELVSQLKFKNGRRIQAVSSRPRSFRGKSGLAVLDEAAFLTDLPAFLKAVLAFRQWGGRIIILSTHDGASNPFNQLILDIRAGRKNYSIHRTTLDDAIAEGLYERICLKSHIPYTIEAEIEWRASLLADYGVDADEELHVIPRASSLGLFHREWFQVTDAPHCSVKQTARAWDLASTAPRKGADPDYTVGVKGSQLADGSIYIHDLIRIHGKPSQVKSLLLSTARQDGTRVEVATFTDPGQAGVYQSDDIVQHLAGFKVVPLRASRNKVDYATPVANFASQGKIYIQRAPWNDAFLSELAAFPSPHQHDDQVDALSRLFIAISRPTFTVAYDSPTSKRDPWDPLTSQPHSYL